MSFSRAFQWYHSHLDPIWPDGTFKSFTYFPENVDEMKFLAKTLRNLITCKYFKKNISFDLNIWDKFCFCVGILRRWQHFHIFVYFSKLFARKCKMNFREHLSENAKTKMFSQSYVYSPHKILTCKAPQNPYPSLLQFTHVLLRNLYDYCLWLATIQSLFTCRWS
jgi:hypothetical protein